MIISTSNFRLIYITSDPSQALLAARSSVDFIMVDLERIGKFERQGHLNTFISSHKPTDISVISSCLSTSGTSCKTLVRVNPLNPGTQDEVDMAISLGADMLMLPMFRTVEQVKSFFSIVRSRVPVILLVETVSALDVLDDILSIP